MGSWQRSDGNQSHGAFAGRVSSEVGSSASHEQSAEEMRVISSSTSVRLQYTGLAIDNANLRTEGQLYAYLMVYGEGRMYGYINAPEEEVKAKLEALGFTVDEEGGEKWKVTALKPALQNGPVLLRRDGRTVPTTSPLELRWSNCSPLSPLACWKPSRRIRLSTCSTAC